MNFIPKNRTKYTNKIFNEMKILKNTLECKFE